MGLNSRFVKPKSGYEDVTIFLDNNAIVCDAKSFRLGRSQKAPNVKDFIKLQDIRHWLSRYDKKIGRLVTYPCRHEWSSSSNVYEYCTTKDTPTLMLPYKYLAFLLKYKNSFINHKIGSNVGLKFPTLHPSHLFWFPTSFLLLYTSLIL